jgi:hypothetical protein
LPGAVDHYAERALAASIGIVSGKVDVLQPIGQK